MDIRKYYANAEEKPLDQIAVNGGFTRIFRRIACIGDSLSSGEFQLKKRDGSFDYYDMYEYSWGQHIARMTGSTVYNFSKGGMTAREYCEGYAEFNSFWNPEKACQAYIIALGCNDQRKPEEIGTLADIDFTDYRNNQKTFVGCYGKIIQRIKEIQPRAKFFLVTMPREKKNEEGSAKSVICKRIREMADHFDNTYVIDLYQYAPIYDAEFKEAFFMEGHMNPQGYVLTADMIASYIDYIIRNHPTHFEEIAFIGTSTTSYKGE